MLSFSHVVGAQVDSVANSSQQEELLGLDNLWLKSSNPAGLCFNADGYFSDVKMEYQWFNGDIKAITAPSSQRNFNITSQSYLKMGDISLFGLIEYKNISSQDVRWAGVMMDILPFTIGDSITSDHYQEYYHLSGAVASPLGKSNFCLGADIDYSLCKGSKNKDPRSLNTGMTLKFKPGLIYKTANSSYGINVLFSNFKEEINIKNVASSLPRDIFFFQGLGFYRKKSVSNSNLSVIYKGDGYGVALNGEFGLSSNCYWNQEFSYLNEKVSCISAPTNPRKEGDVKNSYYKCVSAIKLQNRSGWHTLDFNAEYVENSGTEFDQKKEQVIQEDITQTHWVTQSSDVVYTQKNLSTGLNYHFLILSEGKKRSDIYGGIDYYAMDKKYYYTPQIFNVKYSNVISRVGVFKRFKKGRNDIVFGGAFTYEFNVDYLDYLPQWQEINGTILKYTDVFVSDFKSMASDCLKYELSGGYDWPVKLSGDDNGLVEIRLKYSSHKWDSVSGKQKRDYYNISMGLYF